MNDWIGASVRVDWLGNQYHGQTGRVIRLEKSAAAAKGSEDEYAIVKLNAGAKEVRFRFNHLERVLFRPFVQRENNIAQDSFDQRVFEELRDASSELTRLEAAEKVPWPPIPRDIFSIFYKMLPELLPEEAVRYGYRPNRELLRRILDDPNVEQARVATMLDDLASGLATLETATRLLEEIRKRPELQKIFDQAGEAAQAESDGDQQKAAGLAKQALEGMDKHAQALRRAVRKATQAGRDKAEETAATAAGWGLDGSDLRRMPLGQRLELMAKLSSSRMKKLAQMIGRFRNLARQRQRQRIRHRRDEIHSIRTGRDISHLLPTEIAALKDPVRRLDFARRFAEGSLLEYDLQARERQMRGPMVVLVDKSGSMSGYPMDWAVATALALVDTAARQKRRAYVAFFDTKVVQATEFAAGERDPEKFASLASVSAGGGTDYWPAFRTAAVQIDKRGFTKADVVLVTDGVCQMERKQIENLLAYKQKHDFRVWSVLIGDDPYGELRKWSDQVWAVRYLDEDIAGEIFEVVA